MEKLDFNGNWTFRMQGESNWQKVTLPHDAQIHQKREKNAPGGSGHGFFPGGIYEYEKTFAVSEDLKGKKILVEFEGIYKNSTVVVNGQNVGGQPYGYTGFVVDLTQCLIYGKDNVIKIKADNSMLPNSRWYTGGGIYRPVWMWIGEASHIAYQGIRITTLSISPARIRVQVDAEYEEDTVIDVQILYKGSVVATNSGTEIEFTIPDARLWSAETPYLYQCRVSLKKGEKIVDEAEENFGIRLISYSNKGLFINGKETLLRGGCVHHDNGILGAATYDKSEYRRVRIMKEAGFNAIRSAHNPCSRAMLEACDRYGMYMMDETFDMWYNRKNKYDYGCDFEKWWESDTVAMVKRDYNHPCVILYSIGNEVAEPYEEKGVHIGQKQIDLIHSMDSTRPVTCGVNLMILRRAAKGNGIYKDGEMNIAASGEKEEKSQNASLAFNIMASFIGTGMNKGGNSKKVDTIASPFVDSLDIAGYNYGSGRYPLEEKEHPNRIIFGSETFPQDIAKNWGMVKRYPYLIGDFMWTAWDYLGEAGIGAWSYTGGMPFNRPYPWLLSGAGVIDILGVPDASCRYAAVVWGQLKKPAIGVRPVNHPGVRVSKSVWRGTNAIESWAWQGCDGNKAIVEVFSDSFMVELILNGKSLGKKRVKEYKAVFKTAYIPGTLEAVAYDASGREVSRSCLKSATGKKRLDVRPEEESMKVGEIMYFDVSVIGENGVVESNTDSLLEVKVEGGSLLGFGSANPCTEECFDSGKYTTYHGRAQVVVRAEKAGVIQVKVSGGGMSGKAQINVYAL